MLAEQTEGSLLQYQEQSTMGSAFLVETIPAGKHYDYDVDAAQIAAFSELVWRNNN